MLRKTVATATFLVALASPVAAATTAQAAVSGHRIVCIKAPCPNGWYHPHTRRVLTPQPTTRTYTVKPGDDLWGIAVKMYGHGTWRQREHAGHKWVVIARRNHISTTHPVIYPGQTLHIPVL